MIKVTSPFFAALHLNELPVFAPLSINWGMAKCILHNTTSFTASIFCAGLSYRVCLSPDGCRKSEHCDMPAC